MAQLWENYPASAILRGVRVALSGWTGLVLSFLGGTVIGFAGHDADELSFGGTVSMLYLLIVFPFELFAHLRDASGDVTALVGAALITGFRVTERFKAECLFGLCLIAGLYVFQAVARGHRIQSDDWMRFACIAGALIVLFLVARMPSGSTADNQTG
jgi:hypothetical protein